MVEFELLGLTRLSSWSDRHQRCLRLSLERQMPCLRTEMTPGEKQTTSSAIGLMICLAGAMLGLVGLTTLTY